MLDRQLGAYLADEATDTAPFLAHLLGLPLHAEEADRALLDPETMQIRYVASVHRLLRALSTRGPVVLVCEDMHWADPASVALVSQLLPLAAQLPVLFIATLRADTDSAGWRLISAARELFGDALTDVRLQPLSETDGRDLGWGETLRAAGRRAESDATLHRALALFEEMGIAPEAEAVRVTLAGETQDASC